MMEAIRGQLRGRKLCLIPDGSKINLNVEAMIARYLNDDDDPCSLCVAVRKVGKGLDADTMLYMLQQDVDSLQENILALALPMEPVLGSGMIWRTS
jgi:hypothetical protein